MKAGHDDDRERDLFEKALELPTAPERQAFLKGACGGDMILLDRVLSLLAAHEKAGGFLGGAAEPSHQGQGDGSGRTTVGGGLAEKPGDLIGRYKLLEKIGEGGFGIVYLADQREPVRRRVALKIIKLGMDTRQVVARFEVERQALALMDHPNIARVLDAGATDTGRPFFVMELVKGVPITQYSNDHRLTQHERLLLFLQVCHAVQHAHQKGVIHRDLKPSNVLVAQHDDSAVPKVIDFGIAKATQQELTGITLFTRFHEFVGTPAYMSPEQARFSGLDVDTRTDIYSLGVLLYELLTGRTPFDASHLAQAGYDEIRRHILDKDPPRPSTRLSTLSREEKTTTARQRRADPERMIRQLRGDLDWIILKCLEKDRSRRYESASALAQDIIRHLNNRPVVAAAPGPWYRMTKFARRHQAALVTGSLLLLLLLAGTITSTWFAVQARRAEHRALAEAADAEAVLRFLNEDLLSQADPALEPDREIRLRTLLDRASGQVDARFMGAPNVAALVHSTIGRAYAGLGEYAAAAPHFQRCLDLFTRELGNEHPQVVRALSDLAYLKSRQGDHQAARALGENSLKQASRSLGRSHPLTIKCLSRLSEICALAGDKVARRTYSREAVDLCRKVAMVDPEDHAAALQAWGRSLGTEGRIDEGEIEMRSGHQLLLHSLGPSHPQTLTAQSRLAAFLYDHQRKAPEAERLWLDVLDTARRTLGETHPRTRISRWNLVLLYRYRLQDRVADALHHQFRLIEYSSASDRSTYLAALRDFLPQVPPGVLPTLKGLQPDGWESRTEAPVGDWKLPGKPDDDWMPTRRVTAEEMWWRQEFTLPEAPPDQRLFVILQNDGDFELMINGAEAAESPRVGMEGFQVLHAMPTVHTILRAGRNCVALRGRNLRLGQELNATLGWVPQPVQASAN